MGLLEELINKRANAYELRGTFIEKRDGFVRAVETQDELIADLDRAIAALSPAPSEEAGKGEDAPEIPEGFTKWEGGDVEWDGQDEDDFPINGLDVGTLVEVLTRDGQRYVDDAHTFVWGWTRNSTPEFNITAYRVLPSEPADEAKGEDDTPVYGDDLAYGDGNDARIGNMPIECNPYEGKKAEYWNNGWTDADAIIQLNECAPDTITIAASEQHAEESALVQASGDEDDIPKPDIRRAWIFYRPPAKPPEKPQPPAEQIEPEQDEQPPEQDQPDASDEQEASADLAPLLPPERPPAATPEQLEATGVIDSEASWWARKLAKEPA